MTTMKTTAISTGAERPIPGLRPARENELPQLERMLEDARERLRADTHRGNAPMRALLEGAGFRLCGIIRLCSSPEPDPERLAYQKIL